MNSRERERTNGELRLLFGDVFDDQTLERMDGQALEVREAKRKEYSIALQSEFWRLRVDISDETDRKRIGVGQVVSA